MPDVFLNQIDAFLLGTLDHFEEKQLLQHLASSCAECNKSLAESSRLIRALPWASELIEPPASLKSRLMNSIKNSATSPAASETGVQVWKTWPTSSPRAGLFCVRADEGDWEDIDINGFQVKRLFVDETNDSVTMLVRAPGGAAYPRHRHAGPEQCYVLQGDLHVGDTILRAGDYQYAPPDSIHGIQSTEGGCMLLIVSSLHDEILEKEDA